MAVVLSEEEKNNFRKGITKLKDDVSKLLKQLKSANDKLTNDVATAFKKSSDSGKKTVTKLGTVISKLRSRQKDLENLIAALEKYIKNTTAK